MRGPNQGILTDGQKEHLAQYREMKPKCSHYVEWGPDEPRDTKLDEVVRHILK